MQEEMEPGKTTVWVRRIKGCSQKDNFLQRKWHKFLVIQINRELFLPKFSAGKQVTSGPLQSCPTSPWQIWAWYLNANRIVLWTPSQPNLTAWEIRGLNSWVLSWENRNLKTSMCNAWPDSCPCRTFSLIHWLNRYLLSTCHVPGYKYPRPWGHRHAQADTAHVLMDLQFYGSIRCLASNNRGNIHDN